MALAAKKPERTYEKDRLALLDKVPDFMIPIQMGPGVSDTVSLRELVDQIIPRNQGELAISALPMGKLFSMAPAPMKAGMMRLLRGAENKARVAKKMLEGSPVLGKAAEALGLFTGKVGGYGSDIREGSTRLDELYNRLGKLVPTGLPEVDTRKAFQSFPADAAAMIDRAMTRGLPKQKGLRRVTPGEPLLEADPEALALFREIGEFPPSTGVHSPYVGEAEPVDISDIEKLLTALAKRRSSVK